MPRAMNPAVKTILEADQTKLCSLVSLDFNDTAGPVRVNNTGVNLDWNGDTYLGLGQLGTISGLEESQEVQSYELTFTLHINDSVLLAKALDSDYKGRFAYLYIAALDDNYQVEDDPLLVFAGRMYTMAIQLGKEGAISVTASSRLTDWENAHGGRFNHSTQFTRMDPDDKGFEYVTSLADTEIVWGASAPGVRGPLSEYDQNFLNHIRDAAASGF